MSNPSGTGKGKGSKTVRVDDAPVAGNSQTGVSVSSHRPPMYSAGENFPSNAGSSPARGRQRSNSSAVRSGLAPSSSFAIPAQPFGALPSLSSSSSAFNAPLSPAFSSRSLQAIQYQRGPDSQAALDQYTKLLQSKHQQRQSANSSAVPGFARSNSSLLPQGASLNSAATSSLGYVEEEGADAELEGDPNLSATFLRQQLAEYKQAAQAQGQPGGNPPPLARGFTARADDLLHLLDDMDANTAALAGHRSQDDSDLQFSFTDSSQLFASSPAAQAAPASSSNQPQQPTITDAQDAGDGRPVVHVTFQPGFDPVAAHQLLSGASVPAPQHNNPLAASSSSSQSRPVQTGLDRQLPEMMRPDLVHLVQSNRDNPGQTSSAQGFQGLGRERAGSAGGSSGRDSVLAENNRIVTTNLLRTECCLHLKEWGYSLVSAPHGAGWQGGAVLAGLEKAVKIGQAAGNIYFVCTGGGSAVIIFTANFAANYLKLCLGDKDAVAMYKKRGGGCTYFSKTLLESLMWAVPSFVAKGMLKTYSLWSAKPALSGLLTFLASSGTFCVALVPTRLLIAHTCGRPNGVPSYIRTGREKYKAEQERRTSVVINMDVVCGDVATSCSSGVADGTLVALTGLGALDSPLKTVGDAAHIVADISKAALATCSSRAFTLLCVPVKAVLSFRAKIGAVSDCWERCRRKKCCGDDDAAAAPMLDDDFSDPGSTAEPEQFKNMDGSDFTQTRYGSTGIAPRLDGPRN